MAKSICPHCGNEPSEEIWLYYGKLFCTEKCVREYAQTRRRDERADP